MPKRTQAEIDEMKEEAERRGRDDGGASVFFSTFDVAAAQRNLKRARQEREGVESNVGQRTAGGEQIERLRDDGMIEMMNPEAVEQNLTSGGVRLREDGEIVSDEEEEEQIRSNEEEEERDVRRQERHLDMLEDSLEMENDMVVEPSTTERHVVTQSSNRSSPFHEFDSNIYEFEREEEEAGEDPADRGGGYGSDSMEDINERTYITMFESVGIMPDPEVVPDEPDERSTSEEDPDDVVVLNRRAHVDRNADRHRDAQIDIKNHLYALREEDDSVDWYFTNSHMDVKDALAHYTTHTTNDNKRYLRVRKEELTDKSSLTRLSTNMGSPLIIFFNQLYKPKEEAVDGSIVARCALRFPTSSKQTCRGSIYCDRNTGEVRLHEECVHESQRDEIAIQLIVRKCTVNTKIGFAHEEQYGHAVQLARSYEIPEKLFSNQQLRRKMFGKLGMTSTNVFPPTLDFLTLPNAKVLLDTSGNYDIGHPVIIMWMAEGAQQYINSAHTINCDGKFSEIPAGFLQLYCISKKDENSDAQIPLIFVLTDSKTQQTYEKIFDVAQTNGLMPYHVYSDFESATIRAAQSIWPTAEIRGCWRHWKVALLKKLMKIIPKDDWAPHFTRFIRCVYGLSFAPLDKVDDWFQIIENTFAGLHQKMPGQNEPKNFYTFSLKNFDYFAYLKSTWFNMNARFPRQYWHCGSRALLGHDYTNNGSEQLFAKYKRLFQHTNYKVLHLAVSISISWSRLVFDDVQNRRNWNAQRADRPPLYRNNDFLTAVHDQYVNYPDFNSVIYHYMREPKLFH